MATVGRKPIEETPEMIEQVRQLVLDGLDFQNHIYGALGISHTTWHELVKRPGSELLATISAARAERESEVHKIAMDMVKGKDVDRKTQANMTKFHIQRTDKVEGRYRDQVHVTVSPQDKLTDDELLDNLLAD